MLASLCLTLLLGVVLAPLTEAAWSATGAGTASALADTMPSGSQPSASPTGTSVSLRWTAALLPGNEGVAGYVIHRFAATGGAEATVGPGCSGVVTTTICTEANVPAGTWVYTDTPVQDSWSGGQSAASAPVTVP
jgi:hypothetical protein